MTAISESDLAPIIGNNNSNSNSNSNSNGSGSSGDNSGSSTKQQKSLTLKEKKMKQRISTLDEFKRKNNGQLPTKRHLQKTKSF